jgi:hypothetical protein
MHAVSIALICKVDAPENVGMNSMKQSVYAL